MPFNEIESGGGSWKPKEVGEKLSGVLKERKLLPGRNNQNYTLFTIVDEKTGEERFCSGAVLESKLGAEDGEGNLLVPNGTKVILTYKGKPKGTYLDFGVQAWSDEPKL